MHTKTINQGKRFFQYLLELNQLVGNVTRDYREFERSWFLEEFAGVKGCFLFDECKHPDAFLEIYRQEFTSDEDEPPKPPELVEDWLEVDPTVEQEMIRMPTERQTVNRQGVLVTEGFTDDPERVAAYQAWEQEWNEWAAAITGKKQAQRLYEEFFNLIQQMEREGETLEFIYGNGILCWEHPDSAIGTIRSPLLTVRLSLELHADVGVIIVKGIDPQIHVEREIFSGIRLPNIEQVNQAWEEVQSRDILQDLSDFFHQFIHLIDAKGKYVEQASTLPQGNSYPIIVNESFFSLRKKDVRVLRDDLDMIITGIEREEIDVPESIAAIMGMPSEQKVPRRKSRFNDLPLYFPLDANEQQKEIVHRFEQHYGVSVQGPPGTGKTHTIANLVSHFLTQGKKILITSQKASPLRVLKDKIPDELKDLCVPVLGGGRESLQEIEQSIRVISENLGNLDVQRLAIEIERDQQALEQSKQQEATLRKRLQEHVKKEGTPLEYQGKPLFRYEVAKQLAASSVEDGWIQDDIPVTATFPLHGKELKELWQLAQKLQPEDRELEQLELPQEDGQIRPLASFQAFMQEGERLQRHIEQAEAIIEQYQLQLEPTLIEQLLADIEAISRQGEILTQQRFRPILDDFAVGGVREKRWRTLLNELSAAKEQFFQYHHQLVTHTFQLPEKPIRQLKQDVSIARERLQSGKSVNLIFLFGKGKAIKYLFQTPILDGQPIRELNDLDLLESYLQFELDKQEIARIFNGHMNDVGIEPISPEEKRFAYVLEERLEELQPIVQLVDAIQHLREKLESFQMQDLRFFSIDTYQKLKEELKRVLSYIDYQEWFHRYGKEYQQLQRWANKENAHSVWREFVSAFAANDQHQWEQALDTLTVVRKKKAEVTHFYQLWKSFAEVLPQTAQWLIESDASQSSFPDQYLAAFEQKKLRTWLDETMDTNYEKLERQIQEQAQEQKRLIRRIVRQSTWKTQIERMTEEEKRALSAWKTNIKRYGKGSGKYAHIYLQNAREQMKTAQTAIPVWIMPVTQVLENFPATNEKFDVVIFDESSQCDLYATNVLLRGKKAIVVGDDEQISPQAIGTKFEDVQDLSSRYLSGVPNANLFDGNISLYEIAEQAFPKEGKLMLKEHFRCVPEIIQFSNDLSYGGQMVPLRLPLEEDKLEPPVMAIHVDASDDEQEPEVNQAEIDAIVRDIKQMVQDPVYQNQTIGVIVLEGQKQAKLLETSIRKTIGDQEFVHRKIICGNPYTLQGDERDVILLSMVVTPHRRFQSLIKTEYKQRFNVAASRARNQMRLYHSVLLEDLHPEDLRYQLLSYCQQPMTIETTQTRQEEMHRMTSLESDLFKMIQQRGYTVKSKVHVGNYLVDLVIEGSRERLAIECEGDRWIGKEPFLDEVKKQESLQRAGWKFWRVRGREFYFDPDATLRLLWEQLDDMGILPVKG